MQDPCEDVRNLIDNTVLDDINITQLHSEITGDEVVTAIKKNSENNGLISEMISAC